MRIKFCSYNIRYCLGVDGTINVDRITDVIARHDIIALQEVERYWKHSDMSDQPDEISRRLPDHYWVYKPGFDVDASYQDNGKVVNRRRQHGSMILSRWPILSCHLITLPKLVAHQHFNMTMAAVEVIIAISGAGAIRLYSLHLASLSERERLYQIKHLLKYHQQTALHGPTWSGNGEIDDPVEAENVVAMDWRNGENDLPQPAHTLIMGDFNMEPDGAGYREMVGDVDACSGRVAYVDRFIDAWHHARHRGDNEMTWRLDPPERPPGRPMRIDYCFTDPSLVRRIHSATVEQVLNASDHMPLNIEIDL